MHASTLLFLLLAAPAAPDTLVVCPAEFRPALAAWQDYRRDQGHEILVIDPPNTAAQLQAQVRRVAQAGRLKYIVLIGDVPDANALTLKLAGTGIVTNYLSAKINKRWGSEPTIASDIPYADLDGDDLPDLAIGRIPVDSPTELAAVVRKVIRYERETGQETCKQRLDVVAGVGGFGAVADSLIEAAGRQVMQQVVPPDYEIRYTPAKCVNPMTDELRTTVHRQFGEGSLAWIYMGHGLPTELDRVSTPTGNQPILSIDDVPRLRCSSASPLAVLISCYTGAFDASSDCLAEELALAEEGPVAVVAATRVTMPYGNTVFGYELLRACFDDRPIALGDMLRLAQCRTLPESIRDPLRPSMDALAQGLSPPPVDLPAERREHVWMYHLFGDPLVQLRVPPPHVDAQVGQLRSAQRF